MKEIDGIGERMRFGDTVVAAAAVGGRPYGGYRRTPKEEKSMRLVTRSDFDGLACAALLVEAGIVDEYLFVHPKDIQDGRIEVTENDVLANVPYAPGCGLWFDHHASENDRLGMDDGFQFKGMCRIVASCARLIYEYYGGPRKFTKFDNTGLMAAVDKVDSGQLYIEEVLSPTGWILLGFIMDPRTGLGYHKEYRISNLQLMEDMIQYCRTMTSDQILQVPDVQERVRRYFKQEAAYEQMLKENSRVDDIALITNLLDVPEVLPGNRFKEYALFPQVNISLRILWGKDRKTVTFTCGHSIFNRTSMVNVGPLMLRYGGGGHTRVGTCQVPTAEWQRCRDEIIAAMKSEPALTF